jgi:hypothetical protein
MKDKPVFYYPITFRNYEMFREECIYAKGWNDAMREIFEIKESSEQYLKRNGMKILKGKNTDSNE